jgi:polysaccharide biosynthesis/export protein
MHSCRGLRSLKLAFVGIALCMAPLGCVSPQIRPPVDSKLPVELNKASLPTYVIEPPDILLLDVIRVVPKPPYHIEPLDALYIRVPGALTEEPIQGIYVVEPEGTVALGASYGKVFLAGMTTDQAKAAIENQLKKILKAPETVVAIAQSRGVQQIRGEHLVRPDGTVSLGNYGSVYITGMTVAQAKEAIERHLSQFVINPEVSVDLLAYNSKVFYVITDGAGFGQQVYRLPSTGNETVLDAVAQVNGLPAMASKHHIWVARPAPAGAANDQILPVDWNAITECGKTDTNYQVFPGDRIYVKADALITLDNWLAKITNPMNRLFGTVLLGSETGLSLRFAPSNATGGTGGVGVR